jgi:propanol-preferring alcohol dehydrogenase
LKALRFVAPQQPPELADVDVPEPGPGQVLVKVGGAGACHSDLHVMDYPMLPWPVPFTLGHETAGWVAATGAGVSSVAEGDAVAVYGAWGCGLCANCRAGAVNYCDNNSSARTRDLLAGRLTDLGAVPPVGIGLGADGGMAEFVVVPSVRYLVPLASLDPVAAAPLTDAGLTPYHAVKRSLRLLVPGSTVVVIGAGGLGHMAIQILRSLAPARIVAVDVSEAKLALAKAVGADDAVSSGPDTSNHIWDLTAGRGAEVVLDFVGADATIALGAQVVRSQGDLTVVGLAGGTYAFGAMSLPYATRLSSVFWGTIPELGEVLALAEAGKISARVERFTLDDAPTAYERMREGTLDGRAVVVPNAAP